MTVRTNEAPRRGTPRETCQAEAELGLESQILKRGKSITSGARRGSSEGSGIPQNSLRGPGAVASCSGWKSTNLVVFSLSVAYCHMEVGMIS